MSSPSAGSPRHVKIEVGYKKMAGKSKPIDNLFGNLLERAKELNCIFEVEEIIQLPKLDAKEILIKIGEVIPQAMQYPDICNNLGAWTWI